MKESISYTFLLNIVIVFVFTCFAIVMGVLSYYKAFRANTIISETIEKYEGYNCVSAEEIARKLGNIGYNTPFNVNCNGKGDYCMTDTGQNYAVVSYNLDIPQNNIGSNIIFKDSDAYRYVDNYDQEKFNAMNSTYECDSNGCVTNKHYQYGIYTYMYIELPVISSLIKIPFFSKTSIMYEFRNIYAENYATSENNKTFFSDVESSYKNLYYKETKDGKIYVKDAYLNKCVLNSGESKIKEPQNSNEELQINLECTKDSDAHLKLMQSILNAYAAQQTSKAQSQEEILQMVAYEITNNQQLDYRTRAITIGYSDRLKNKLENVIAFQPGRDWQSQRQFCGYIMDYSTIN